MGEYVVGIDDIREAARRIAPAVRRTPVLTSRSLSALASQASGSEVELFFKCENLQRCGSFKFRGAMNATLGLTEAEAARGLVTASSGNHGQALAHAAQLRGVPCSVVMPTDAPRVKRAAVEAFGGRVVPCAPTLSDRARVLAELLALTGGTFISSHNDPRIMAGQGTAALELLDEVPDLDVVITPIGGGGLLSGVAMCVHGLAPSVRVMGAEPAGADDAWQSKRAGRHLLLDSSGSVAEGLLLNMGANAWPIVRDHVAHIERVPDDRTLAAMHLTRERLKLVIEPSAAVAVAAALGGLPGGPRRVGVVLSGGNVDVVSGTGGASGTGG